MFPAADPLRTEFVACVGEATHISSLSDVDNIVFGLPFNLNQRTTLVGHGNPHVVIIQTQTGYPKSRSCRQGLMMAVRG